MRKNLCFILANLFWLNILLSQSVYQLDTTEISNDIRRMMDTASIDPITALSIFDEIEEKVLNEGTAKEKALLYLRVAPVYHSIGNHTRSYDMFNSALAVSKENNLGMEAGIYNNMSMVFAETGNSKLYFKILNEALKVALEKDSSDFTLGVIYNNFGDYYREINKYDSSFIFLDFSLDYFQKAGVEYNLYDAYADKARVHLLKGEYQKGIVEAKTAHDFFINSEYRDLYAKAALILGFNLYKAGRRTEADQYLVNAERVARELGLNTIHGIYNEYWFRFIDHLEKEQLFNRYKAVADSLNFAKYNKNISILLNRMEMDKKIAEEHAAEIARQEEKEISFIIVMLLLTLLGIILGGGLYKRNLLNKKLWEYTRELEILSQKFTAFVDQSSNAIKILDLDGNIIYVNKTFEKISGLKSDIIIGKNNIELMKKYISNENSRADYETISEAIRIEFKVNRSFGLTTYEFDFTTSEEKNYSVEETFFPIISGDLLLVGIIANDVTLTKKYENKLIEAKLNAERSDKLKTEFLAQMSHEIRTPINAILSMVKIVELETKEQDNGNLGECFNSIDNSSNRLIRTIDSILNMSEVQTGAYNVNPRRFYLFKDLIQPLLTEFKIAANLKKINLIVNDTLPNTEVYLDHYSMTQVFSNLFENAIKFTEEGELVISILKNKQQKIEVEIKDTGVGISDEFVKELFEPFTQEHQGYSRRFEGTGLGLALAKKYCDLNNVDIKVESKKNVGTSFRLTI